MTCVDKLVSLVSAIDRRPIYSFVIILIFNKLFFFFFRDEIDEDVGKKNILVLLIDGRWGDVGGTFLVNKRGVPVDRFAFLGNFVRICEFKMQVFIFLSNRWGSRRNANECTVTVFTLDGKVLDVQHIRRCSACASADLGQNTRFYTYLHTEDSTIMVETR